MADANGFNSGFNNSSNKNDLSETIGDNLEYMVSF